jgi:hypothetical protein
MAFMSGIDGGDELEIRCHAHRQTDLTTHPTAGSHDTDLAHG